LPRRLHEKVAAILVVFFALSGHAVRCRGGDALNAGHNSNLIATCAAESGYSPIFLAIAIAADLAGLNARLAFYALQREPPGGGCGVRFGGLKTALAMLGSFSQDMLRK